MAIEMAVSDSQLQQHKDTVFAAIEAASNGELDRWADLVTEDYTVHQVRWPLDTVGRAANREKMEELMETFSDYHATVEDIVAEGDRVAVYLTVGARHTGPLTMGDRELAPTGESYEVPQFLVHRFEDGKIAETWLLADVMGIAEQTKNLPVGPGKLVRFVLRQVGWRLRGKPRLD